MSGTARGPATADGTEAATRSSPRSPVRQSRATTTGVVGKNIVRRPACGCDDSCGPLTPNGCDCFGCCTLPGACGHGRTAPGHSSARDEERGPARFADLRTRSCAVPCTPAGNCLNTCERCELCLGKTELPADCFPGSGGSGGTAAAAAPAARTAANAARRRRQPCGLPGDAPSVRLLPDRLLHRRAVAGYPRMSVTRCTSSGSDVVGTSSTSSAPASLAC